MKRKLPVVDARYPSRRAVLSSVRSQGSKLMLFVASDAVFRVGSRVELRVTIAGTSQAFKLVGTVLDHAWAGHRSRASGLTVSFQGEDKKHAAEMVAVCADRPPAMGTANSWRVDLAVRCKVKGIRGSSKGVISDLSRTGAFIATEMPRLQPGSPLRVQLEPSVLGLVGAWLDAKVIWWGDKGGRPGLGIQFVGTKQNQTKALNKYLKTDRR